MFLHVPLYLRVERCQASKRPVVLLQFVCQLYKHPSKKFYDSAMHANTYDGLPMLEYLWWNSYGGIPMVE